MLSDPISMSIEGSVRTLNRVNTVDGATYRSADGVYELRIMQSRDNYLARLVKYYPDTNFADGFQPALQNAVVIGGVRNAVGYQATDIPGLRTDLSNWFTSAIAARVLAGEA